MSSHFQMDEFITAYCNAFENGTGVDIAAFYFVPCLTVRGDGSLHVFKKSSDIEAFFENVVTTYRGEGMTSFACRSPYSTKLGSACANMSCEWMMLKEDGNIIRSWNQTYTFKNNGDGWRIIVSIFHT